ncbi:MAG: transglycosylase SLT domain-containing protein [Actinobacteria bacterium]|nr:transglycosylase SLT domain-containing protein [Actinomycetota bacterium]
MNGRVADGERGQVTVLLLAGCLVLAVATMAFAQYGTAFVARGRLQRGADLAATAAAKRMSGDFARLSAPATLADGRPNPLHMQRDAYLLRARFAARRSIKASRLSVGDFDLRFEPVPAPTVVTARIRQSHAVHVPTAGREDDREVELRAKAVARLSFSIGTMAPSSPSAGAGGGYAGPLAYRQGKAMRPDVAAAFDRMCAAARRDGLSLTIASAFRSDAEQARLFAQHPDPKWVAPPGTSLHRYGTELDLGPPAAYGWLAANARGFGFIKRYAWEPWHFGLGVNPRDVPAQYERGSHEPRNGRFDEGPGLPSWVPALYAPVIARAAQRYNVQGDLLAAQLWTESRFNPNAVSRAGAQGIAQFMPATAASVGLRDPFDPDQAINAQARLLSGLIHQFGSVALALAAYNAGPGAVQRYGGVPPFAETKAYVARILLLMKGGGLELNDPAFAGMSVHPGVELIE